MTDDLQEIVEGEDADHSTIMALAQPVPAQNRNNRVKVYELKQNDWYDRGTGFCHGATINDEAHLIVLSEDEPTRELLQTRISKDGGGYQKQQATLIVWTEENNTDMALSFQEAEGCANIWEFISDVQQRLNHTGQGKISCKFMRDIGGAEGTYDMPDDSLSDEVIENSQPVALPSPELGNLQDVDNMVRLANTTQHGRDSLSKFIIGHDYIAKLVPLVEMAEDLESLPDLHRLCNIMKIIILLNDNAIIEYIVTDDIILGVVGALEYDPDFPSHKANHRQYLSDESRFKEVVKIEDPNVKTKIHYIYRLQYLKDVVLARILDDPTFSVLHSLIFYHQVDIVQHIQENTAFLEELFSIFSLKDDQAQRKKDAVLFIQQCTAIARGLQLSARSSLYQNFISYGLFSVISFALRHEDASIRVAGTDVLVALVDHDAAAIRAQIFKAINENTKPLTDTLIELLLIEIDLGVKAQIADVIKVLLDPNSNSNPNPNAQAAADNGNNTVAGRQNADYVAKVRNGTAPAPQTEGFIQNFYDKSAKKLFEPFESLERRISLSNLTIQEVSLFSHLVEILCFFVRQHTFRSKYFILSENLASRVAQLLSCPKKHLKLSAIKYFRTCIGLHDIFHNKLIMQNNLLEPILDIVIETMPKNNLLNSACLELFEFVRNSHIEILINSLMENCREKLESITYVDTFQLMIRHHDDLAAAEADGDRSFSTVDAVNTPNQNIIKGGQRWQGLKDADAEEEAYFNSSDNEEEEGEEREGGGQEYGGFSHAARSSIGGKYMTNGASPIRPLVDYPVDEEDEEGDGESSSGKRIRRANDAIDGVDDDDDNDMDIVGQIPVTTNASMNTRNAPYNYNISNKLHNDRTNAVSSISKSPTPPSNYSSSKSSSPVPIPPERLSEKRRREEDDDEDELGKLSAAGSKRRSSSASISSLSSTTSASAGAAAAPAPTIPLSSNSTNPSSSTTATNTKPTSSSLLTSSSSSSSSSLSHANAAVQSVVHTLRRKKSMTGSGSSKSNSDNTNATTTVAGSENANSGGGGGGGLFGSFGSLKKNSQLKQQQQQQQNHHQQHQKKSKAKIAISLGGAKTGLGIDGAGNGDGNGGAAGDGRSDVKHSSRS